MANYQRRITVQDCVNRVLGSFGLPLANSVVDSTEGNTVQMLTLLNDVGQKLIGENEWQFLSRDQTITLDGSVRYSLPADFDRYIVDSQWNYTTRLPALGSVNTQNWQQLKARQLGGTTLAVMFRLDNDVVELYSDPAGGQQLVFPYVSRGWVMAADQSLRDNVQANDDTILYPSELIREALTLRWMEKKGLDTTKQEEIVNQLLGAAKSKDSPSSTVSIVPGGGIPLIGPLNMPVTGYGS